jgi:pyruvate formate lyase activating enzyme
MAPYGGLVRPWQGLLDFRLIYSVGIGISPLVDALQLPTVKEARLFSKLQGERVRCELCERRCTVGESDVGFCRTRRNMGGKLYTLAYGDISAISVNPIEKKPFFHYHPGTKALTFSCFSCNFSCPWCQNWDISRRLPDPSRANFVDVHKMLGMALSQGCSGFSASFNEPTLSFEYCLDLFPIARDRGLYTNFVSNGYMSEEALVMLREAGMDAIKIDVKGDREVYRRFCGGVDVEIVWRNARLAKKAGLHVEVVNLLIPHVNDDAECIGWIVDEHIRNAGIEVPLHFTRYYPELAFAEPPTPIGTLEGAREVARREGVLYPYIGNVRGHRFEDTWCPRCGELLIKRWGFGVMRCRMTRDHKCPNCGNEVPITS